MVNITLTVHEASGLSGFDHETSENLTTPGAWSGLKGTLITAEGKPVKTFIITSQETQLDVSGLQPGIYLLKITSSQNIVIMRVVIQ